MVLDAKRGRPAPRGGLVHRERPLLQLQRDKDVPLLAVVAPAGYGKTTLLAQWIEQDKRAGAWLTLTERHEDPAYLRMELASELGGEPGGAETPGPPMLVVLDDFQSLSAASAPGVLQSVAGSLPEGSQLALASRCEPALQLGEMRARRALIELRREDLTMNGVEAAELVAEVGLRLDAATLERLLERTEGWPAGLYLAALSLREQPNPDAALARFGGEDRVVTEYLWEAFLAELPEADVTFLTQTSMLPRLSGPLCDAVLEREGSARTLEELAGANLLLAPLQRGREFYRCHGLLRDVLRWELRRGEPGLEAELHRRASAWHAANGELDDAIEHAAAAGDAQRVGDLLWENMASYVTQGRNEFVQRWLGRFAAAEIAAYPSLAMVAAHSHLAGGDIRLAEHWGLAATGALARAATPPNVASLPAGLAIIEAAVGRHGVVPMGRDAARAYDLEDADSPWRSICCLLRGVSDHLAGDRVEAREHLEEGVHRSATQAPNIEALCLAQLATITVEEGDWGNGSALIDRAVAQVDRHGLGLYPTSTLIFAVAAAVHSRTGHVDEGKQDLARATRLLAMLDDFIPWYEAETRIVLARAALGLADVSSARTLLAEASQLGRRFPDATVLQGWIEETWKDLDTAATSALAGSAALTMAELRILRFLPTHLSFREIGSRLHVSTNTVKTQAHAVYRKLDASSRSEAVTRASQIGLLSG